MSQQEEKLDNECPNCRSTKIISKITENNQYIICKKCNKVRSTFQWF